MTLLKQAFDAYAHADTETARRHLVAVLDAVAAEMGGVPDISKVVHAPAKLAAPLADIGGLLLDVLTEGGLEPSQRSHGGLRVEWPDFRMVAELQRDAAGMAVGRGVHRRCRGRAGPAGSRPGGGVASVRVPAAERQPSSGARRAWAIDDRRRPCGPASSACAVTAAMYSRSGTS